MLKMLGLAVVTIFMANFATAHENGLYQTFQWDEGDPPTKYIPHLNKNNSFCNLSYVEVYDASKSSEEGDQRRVAYAVQVGVTNKPSASYPAGQWTIWVKKTGNVKHAGVTCLQFDSPTMDDKWAKVPNPYPYIGLRPVRMKYATGKDYRGDIPALNDYSNHLCKKVNGSSATDKRVFYSPKIGEFSFTTDDRRIMSEANTDNGLGNHPGLGEVEISHILCTK